MPFDPDRTTLTIDELHESLLARYGELMWRFQRAAEEAQASAQVLIDGAQSGVQRLTDDVNNSAVMLRTRANQIAELTEIGHTWGINLTAAYKRGVDSGKIKP